MNWWLGVSAHKGPVAGKAHYSDVIMGAMASKSQASWVFTQPFVQAQIKENIRAQRHCPLWPVNSPYKWPVTRKTFPFHDVIIVSVAWGPFKSLCDLLRFIHCCSLNCNSKNHQCLCLQSKVLLKCLHCISATTSPWTEGNTIVYHGRCIHLLR